MAMSNFMPAGAHDEQHETGQIEDTPDGPGDCNKFAALDTSGEPEVELEIDSEKLAAARGAKR